MGAKKHESGEVTMSALDLMRAADALTGRQAWDDAQGDSPGAGPYPRGIRRAI